MADIKAHVVLNDMLTGGMKNLMDVYLNNTVHHFKRNPNDAFMSYHAEPYGLGDVFFAEKLGMRIGW